MIALNTTNNPLKCEHPSDEYLSDVELLCTQCKRPIKARINTQQWIRVEWIGPEGECLSCYQVKKREREAQ